MFTLSTPLKFSLPWPEVLIINYRKALISQRNFHRETFTVLLKIGETAKVQCSESFHIYCIHNHYNTSQFTIGIIYHGICKIHLYGILQLEVSLYNSIYINKVMQLFTIVRQQPMDVDQWVLWWYCITCQLSLLFCPLMLYVAITTGASYEHILLPLSLLYNLTDDAISLQERSTLLFSL